MRHPTARELFQNFLAHKINPAMKPLNQNDYQEIDCLCESNVKRLRLTGVVRRYNYTTLD